MVHFTGHNRVDTDDGRSVYFDHATGLHKAVAPMKSYNGSLVPKVNRQAPSTDVDTLPHQVRNYVNASGAQDVQIINGLQGRIASGIRWPYRGAGWFFMAAPIIPGQTRGDVAGFHKRGPSPLNYQAMWEAGPGAQPDNPGGPGRIAAPHFFNPMTG